MESNIGILIETKRLSEMSLEKKILIELPDTDSMRLLQTPSCVGRYIEKYGDVEIEVSDSTSSQVWLSVPAFNKGRAEAIESKSNYKFPKL